LQNAIQAADNEIDYRKFVQIIIFVPTSNMLNFGGDSWNIPTDDGVVVNRITIQKENVQLSILAHELGHSLGLDDMYDYALARKGEFTGVYMGIWDPMSVTDNYLCQHFSSYSKIKLNWISGEHIKLGLFSSLIFEVAITHGRSELA
jgi:M6 family metalloprotease-like protein